MELFVREDLSKPENRANVWLLAATGVDLFWTGLAQELGLDGESVVKPIQWEGLRPDITVLRSGEPIAIIECENGSVDGPQNKAFTERCNLPVISIVGIGEPQSGTTWARIREIALQAKGKANDRQAVTLGLLLTAIDDILGRTPHSIMRWLKLPDELPPNPWLLEACRPLLALPADVVGAHAASEGSASIRLRKPKWAINVGRNGLGMAMVQAAQPNKVFLPDPTHLRRHLSRRLDSWAEDWQATLAALLPSLMRDGRGWVTIHLDDSAPRAAEVAASFEKLIVMLKAGDGREGAAAT